MNNIEEAHCSRQEKKAPVLDSSAAATATAGRYPCFPS